MHLRFVTVSAIVGAALASGAIAAPDPAAASAQPVCRGQRITRAGSAHTIYSRTNGGYTRFVSSGGGAYGVDPNSIPEALWKLLKPNGPAVRVTVEGRTCDGGIFYIERMRKPVATPLLPYTP